MEYSHKVITGSGSWEDPETITVQGTDATVVESLSGNPELSWGVEFGVQNESFDTMMVLINTEGGDPAELAGLTEAVMTTMERSPSPQPGPQRPLIYESE